MAVVWDHSEERKRFNEAEMKAHRKKAPAHRSFVFHHQSPKNVLRVLHDDSRVLILAARDNFSDRDKAFFIRHLIAEGFIDDETNPAQASQVTETSVQWQVEAPLSALSAPQPHTRCPQKRTRAFMMRLLICSGLLWLLELALLFLVKL